VGIAVAALAITLWFGMGSEQSWLTGSGWSRILRLSELVACGVLVYFAALGALGFRPMDFSKRAVH
jgi:putative peptidoglycan lipid II flippase